MVIRGLKDMVFTTQYRDSLRRELIEMAKDDTRIKGAAITGSASVDLEDRWSDIDLFFGINEQMLNRALDDWTDLMYNQYGAVHHLDVVSGKTIYRVFLLRNTLQVDLAFSPTSEFGARGATFKLLFGDAVEITHQASPPTAQYLIGYGWLYALHARSCIQREQWWRAEYMVSGIRDTVLSLACLRYKLPLAHARGVDQLPTEVTAPLEKALVKGLNAYEISQSFKAAMNALLVEIECLDTELRKKLDETLRNLVVEY